MSDILAAIRQPRIGPSLEEESKRILQAVGGEAVFMLMAWADGRMRVTVTAPPHAMIQMPQLLRHEAAEIERRLRGTI